MQVLKVLLGVLIFSNDEYYCRLSNFTKDVCIYQCQNNYDRFTWVQDKKDGCPLMKKFYKV